MPNAWQGTPAPQLYCPKTLRRKRQEPDGVVRLCSRKVIFRLASLDRQERTRHALRFARSLALVSLPVQVGKPVQVVLPILGFGNLRQRLAWYLPAGMTNSPGLDRLAGSPAGSGSALISPRPSSRASRSTARAVAFSRRSPEGIAHSGKDGGLTMRRFSAS